MPINLLKLWCWPPLASFLKTPTCTKIYEWFFSILKIIRKCNGRYMSFLPLTVKSLSCFFNSIPTFNDPWRRGPLKIFWEKEKMLHLLHFLLFPKTFVPFLKQNSNFESHLFRRLHELWIWTTNIEKHESIDCIAIFNMISVIWRWPVHPSMLSICSFNPLPRRQHFRLAQIESICRRQIQFYSKH